METIFDYNITEEEKERTGNSWFDKETYLAYHDEDSSNWDLGNLFLARGEIEKAEMFANRLPSYTKQDWYRLKNHIPDFFYTQKLQPIAGQDDE